MFTICHETEVKNFEGFNLSHIQHQLDCDKDREVKYSYFGRRVSRGVAIVHTKYGVMKIKFDECNGWARKIERL